jgi:hypothetical protein
MKKPIRVATIGLLAGILLSFSTVPSVFAQVSLTEAQRQVIRSNCVTIKNSLNQLHASDALLRVNRGQVYESMGSKLMSNFNARLRSNDRDIRGLEVVSGNYQTALTKFREDYRTYEEQLSATIRIDCSAEPDEFHAAVLDSRMKRQTVHQDVLKLHRLIDDYRSAVDDFILNDPLLSEGSE